MALAAKVRGIPATVVMPRTAPAVKKAAVLGYGGVVVECGPTLAERLSTVNEVVERTGGTLIPPFDHADVIAGQGTACLELLEDLPDLDAVVAPIGGGGMLSGWAIVAKESRPGVKVYGAEPLAADDAARSLATGERQPPVPPNSIADGLLTSLGDLTWPIVRDRVDAIFTVNEAEIVAAMRLVWERMKLVIEPSAAVGVAAILADNFRNIPGLKRVGVVLCGGNVSLDKLYW